MLTGGGLSPDDNRVAYAPWAGEQADVFVVNADGSGRRQLTDDPYNDLVPRWSPDGKRIAFYSNRSGDYEIWSINADGSELHQLTQFYDRPVAYPVWSPDGQRMACSDLDEGIVYIFDPTKPWNEQTPVALPSMEDGASFIAWSWSPDGNWLAGFSRTGTNSSGTAIVIYSVETQAYRRVADFGLGPQWLSDSRRLSFPHQNAIYLADIETGAARKLLSEDSSWVGYPTVSADGQWMYFMRQETDSDIWMLTLSDHSSPDS
jgi:Tol biopolymer transport system component